MSSVQFGRLVIVGTGLIGGSLARAVRGHCSAINGASRRAAHLQEAVDLGVIDGYDTDLGQAVAEADLVLIAVPLGAMRRVFEAIAPHLPANCIVTDAGSAKQSVIDDAKECLGDAFARFVPGHPIAGTERSGVSASFAELYQNRKVILTPTTETDPEATAKVRLLWETAGATVVEMEPGHHDEVLAATSHLPHMLAFALVDSLASMRDNDEIFRYAAGGFRDFTRIASSDPSMWRDIAVANRAALLNLLARFRDDLDALTSKVEAGDADGLFELFTEAKAARDRYVDGVVSPGEIEKK